MAGQRTFGNPVAVSDLAAQILDPVLRKRTGLSVALVQSWEEIVGPRLAAVSRPERLVWPRRASEDDPFRPATLVVVASGIAALHLQHETGEVIARANAFLGFEAVGRIRIEQKPLAGKEKPPRRQPGPVAPDVARRIDASVQPVEDDGLRAALARLGRSVHGAKRR
jgi:hypothetical protein